ncbi:MAG: class II aldolase/adducin family protein [Eggerthellaceae bacterium]|nr:class II aldolase/adducin family protein [Eggerthellaceae bacterium]
MVEYKDLDRKVIDELKIIVAQGCRVIGKLGLADYLGHISARIPGTDFVLIKGSGLVCGNLMNTTPDHIVMVDIEGNFVEGLHKQPNETRLHTEIYKARPDVMAVVHDHQHYATALDAAGKKILPMEGVMIYPVSKDVPVFESSLKICTNEQGAAVAKCLGDNICCHLRNHGIVAVGGCVQEAVINAIWLEIQAKFTYMAYACGGEPHPQSPEEVQLNIGQAEKWQGRWAYYTSLLDVPGLLSL